jgi:hypothetical protein
MTFGEKAGAILGYLLGIPVALVSFIRASRMFHPRGVLVGVSVESLRPELIKFSEKAVMRFSSAWWKQKEWRDVLGISIRFDGEQDLLFASFKHPWQTPVGPFLTHYQDFFKNDFFAVSPFTIKGKKESVSFKITPHRVIDSKGSRKEILVENIRKHSHLRLWIKVEKDEWKELADLKLLYLLDQDQEALRFNPFLCGLNIHPKGFIHHLRIGVYRLGQFGRSLR